MKNDFIKELTFKGFTARIKRLSDLLLYDARRIYETTNIGIEPNWHLIFLLLKKEKSLTVTEISQRLGLSHPAIIKIVKKMKQSGYIDHAVDEKDNRKQLLRLTTKGLEELPFLEEKWEIIQSTIKELVDLEFLEKLGEVESRLSQKSLFERCSQKFENHE